MTGLLLNLYYHYAPYQLYRAFCNAMKGFWYKITVHALKYLSLWKNAYSIMSCAWKANWVQHCHNKSMALMHTIEFVGFILKAKQHQTKKVFMYFISSVISCLLKWSFRCCFPVRKGYTLFWEMYCSCEKKENGKWSWQKDGSEQEWKVTAFWNEGVNKSVCFYCLVLCLYTYLVHT